MIQACSTCYSEVKPWAALSLNPYTEARPTLLCLTGARERLVKD